MISYFDSERAHLSRRSMIAFLPLPPFASFFFSPSAFLVLPLFDSVWFGTCQSILQSMMDVRISHPESHPSASSPFPSLPYVRALNASRREGRKGRAGEGAQVTVTTDGGPLRRHRCWQGMECIIILLSDTRKHAEATEARADIRAARERDRTFLRRRPRTLHILQNAVTR